MRERAILSQAKQELFGAIILGDSIVEFAKIPRDLCGIRTLNAGVAGAKISDVARFTSRLLKTIHPQKIVFAVGINDAWANDATSVESFRKHYQRALAASREAGGKIYATTIAPIGMPATTDFNRARIDGFNQVIQSLGVYVIGLDNLAGTDGLLPPTITIDGVHLLPSGYDLWRSALEQGCKG